MTRAAHRDEHAADGPARDESAPETPARTRRELRRLGTRAVLDFAAEVISPRRRLLLAAIVVAAGLAVWPASAWIMSRDSGEDQAPPVLILVFPVLAGAVAFMVTTGVWLRRAANRIVDPQRGQWFWRDDSLLQSSIDARHVPLVAPGTEERTRTAARRAIATHAVGAVGALPLAPLMVLMGVVVLALSWEPWRLLILVSPLLALAGLPATLMAAGRAALVRDAADAVLALPESERPTPPPVVPPHGSRLP